MTEGCIKDVQQEENEEKETSKSQNIFIWYWINI